MNKPSIRKGFGKAGKYRAFRLFELAPKFEWLF